MPELLAAALAHHRAGRLAEAERVYAGILAADPNNADALNLSGVLACQSGRAAQGADSLRLAVSLKPRVPEFHNNLALALQALGRAEEAIACFRQALALNPNYAEAWTNLGNALQNQGRPEQAADCHRRALKLRPAYAEARNNLGNALQALLHFGEAGDAYREAVRLNPRYAVAWNNLGALRQVQGRIEEALEGYRRALAIDAGYHRAHSNLLFALHYDPRLSPEQIFAEHRAWARAHAGFPPPKPPRSRRGGRVRLGYVSPDFRTHSVAWFLEPVLRRHDRARFQVFCYSDVARPDAVTNRLAALADNWRDIFNRTDAEVAELVREDGIDILFDLAGHSAGNRMLLFAQKPAPAAVTWLGYPDTTGLDTMDFRITDARADPPGRTERLHTEQLLRLPQTFLCYQPPEDCPEPGARALPAGEVTFGCFNDLAKVNAGTIALWSALLSRAPRARLVLKARALADPATRQRIRDAFAEHGIGGGRVELCGPLRGLREHLERYRRVDIALDTFPYHGTTTTCEALWMGVPVIVLAGRAHASRVGVSLLASLRLERLAAASAEAYLETAARLAGDPGELRALRAGLRDRMAQSPLMNAALFTRHLEEACLRM